MPTPDERRSVRVWDLVEPSDARLFLADDAELAEQAGRLPLPCRVARLSRLPEEPVGNVAGGGSDVVSLQSQRTLVLAGPHAALAGLAARAEAPWAGTLADALARYAAPVGRVVLRGGRELDLISQVRLMGVINVTPDSFSDGGRFAETEDAVRQGRLLHGEGADVLDVGGESTRPGAAPLGADDERRRVLPVIERLRAELPGAVLSIDTRKARVAEDALAAGADMVNDVSALSDPAMAAAVARWSVPVALMHMRGEPETMQRDTRYRDLLGEIVDFLADRADRARSAGIPDGKILIDPGIGFGKSGLGNEEILRQLGSLRTLGLPILVGASRKSFVGLRTGVSDPAHRLAGSLAAAVAAVLAGARLLRVHDVRATREALAIADAVRRWPEPPGEG
jgi:dihydropteroate synthase